MFGSVLKKIISVLNRIKVYFRWDVRKTLNNQEFIHIPFDLTNKMLFKFNFKTLFYYSFICVTFMTRNVV